MRKIVLAGGVVAAIGLLSLAAPGLADAKPGCLVHAHGHAVRGPCAGAHTAPYRPGQYKNCVWRDHVFMQHGRKMHQQKQVCR